MNTEPYETTIAVDALQPHPRNYNKHPIKQIERIAASLVQFGQVRPIVVQGNTIIAGHGVWQAAQYLKTVSDRDILHAFGVPDNVKKNNKQSVLDMARARIPTLTTLRVTQLPDTWTDEQAMAYLVADNETRRGAEPDGQELATLLDELSGGFDLAALGFSEDDYSALLDELTPELTELDLGVAVGAVPSRRNLPLDVIYTWGNPDATCCIAVQAGLKYGVRSTDYRRMGGPCPYIARWPELHRIVFVDNEYHDYDHALHLSVVQEIRPKYATVRDAMTRKQCQEAGIQYYPLDTILAWADELAQYAENVIVIPKYDCLDQIPEHHMLGYSVPSSYGGTPLHVDCFRGRRVHLLGGGWKNQLAHMAALGDDVMSVDTNDINLIASRFGNIVLSTGDQKHLADLGFDNLTNSYYAAFALTCGEVARSVIDLCSGVT